jgi:hypothetical protein
MLVIGVLDRIDVAVLIARGEPRTLVVLFAHPVIPHHTPHIIKATPDNDISLEFFPRHLLGKNAVRLLEAVLVAICLAHIACFLLDL